MEFLLKSALLNEIEREMCAVTDAQIDRMESKLTPLADRDTSLGTLTNTLTKRLFVLTERLKAKVGEYLVAAKLAETDEQEAELLREASRTSLKQEVIGRLFWLHVREDLNLYTQENIRVREAWIIVETPPEPEHSHASIHFVMPQEHEQNED